ncbi:hypothetical protein FACS1894166_08120 [Bacilli bacterium]|nr:hypothetical protein FACS1894166_08120 [Bacilli bacterium]
MAIKQFRSKIVSKSQGSITEQIDFENLNYGIDDYFDTPPLDKDKIKDEKTL